MKGEERGVDGPETIGRDTFVSSLACEQEKGEKEERKRSGRERKRKNERGVEVGGKKKKRTSRSIAWESENNHKMFSDEGGICVIFSIFFVFFFLFLTLFQNPPRRNKDGGCNKHVRRHKRMERVHFHLIEGLEKLEYEKREREREEKNSQKEISVRNMGKGDRPQDVSFLGPVSLLTFFDVLQHLWKVAQGQHPL